MKNEVSMFLFPKGFFEKEARRIINLLKKDFVFSDGSFFLEKNKDKIYAHHIHADLGDFLPFFLYFNEDTFVKKQIEAYKASLKNNLLISEFAPFRLKNLVKSYEYTDLLLGLCDLYEMRPSEQNKKILVETARTATTIFNLEHKIYSLYYPKFNLRLPIIDTRDGTLIELFCDLQRLTGNKGYLNIAQNIAKQLVSSTFYKEHHLLPTFTAPIFLKMGLAVLGRGDIFYSANICKSTTNSLFGFLALSKCGYKNAFFEIDKIVNKLQKIAEIVGGIPFNYNPNKTPKTANLTPSFATIDFLCDLYHEKNEENYLNFARELANFWLTKQGTTGLFPLDSDGQESFFDSETDMTIALYKLWEKTKEEKYKRAADKCLKAIIDLHGKADYVLSVNIDTGQVVNYTQRTKFLALFLKLLILKIEYDKGKNIYADKQLLNLLRDR